MGSMIDIFVLNIQYISRKNLKCQEKLTDFSENYIVLRTYLAIPVSALAYHICGPEFKYRCLWNGTCGEKVRIFGVFLRDVPFPIGAWFDSRLSQKF